MFIYMVILTTAGARPPRLERGRGVRGVRHGVAAPCLHRGLAAEPGGLIGSGEPGPRWLRMRRGVRQGTERDLWRWRTMAHPGLG